MHQQGNSQFIGNLNLKYCCRVEQKLVNLLVSRIVGVDDKNYPKIFVHIYTENVPVNTHNLNMLDTITYVTYTNLSNCLEIY